MKRALILTYNHFPNGDAGAVRQEVFAKMLMVLGYETFVIGMGESTYFKTEEYSGIRYISFRNQKNDLSAKLNNFLGYKAKLKTWLSEQKCFDVILVVDLPLNAMRFIEHYAKKHQSILLHDSVEWYSAEEFRLRWLTPEYFRKDLKNKYFFKKPWRVIGISSFLTDHFSGKGLKAVRIPVVLDMEETNLVKRCNPEKTLIVYAGAPGGKDCFDQVILALAGLSDRERERLEVRIIGINTTQLRERVQVSEENWQKIKGCVNCIGRVSRQTVLENLEEADYTILLRHAEMRYAKAGFSTKVPESLSTGTPVICNLSSDLGMYLHDGENAIIAEDNTAEAIQKALIRAISCPAEQRNTMKRKAFQTAKDCFDYRCYLNELRKLIEQ